MKHKNFLLFLEEEKEKRLHVNEDGYALYPSMSGGMYPSMDQSIDDLIDRSIDRLIDPSIHISIDREAFPKIDV